MNKMDLVDAVYRAAEARKVTIHLPVDHVCATRFLKEAQPLQIKEQSFAAPQIGLDIGSRTLENIGRVTKRAKSVFWNGPVGVFETKEYANGTNSIAQFLAESDATTIVGGGDSIAAINQSGYADRIHHISTGGGASLEFLEGKTLPGISVLQ